MKYVLINGATSGIGYDAAKDLSAQGFKVFAAGRRVELAEELAQKDSNIIPLKMDVTDDASVQAAIDVVKKEVGEHGLWGLVNSAGLSVAGVTELATDAELRRGLEVNYFGLMRITRAVLPMMHAKGEGRIVNMSSVAGVGPGIFIGPYMGSKHAVEGLSKALRRELIPHNIFVTIIRPGPIKTDFALAEVEYMKAHAKLDSPYKQAISDFVTHFENMHANGRSTKVVTSEIVKAMTVAKPSAGMVIGTDLKLVCWLTKMLPEKIADRIMYRALGIGKHLQKRNQN